MTSAAQFDDKLARRNAMVLAIAQGGYGSTTTMFVATAGLVGVQLAPDPSWATLPQSIWVIGTALTTMPLSLAMKYIGRRNGFLIGAAAGLISGVLGLLAIYQRSFAMFLAAALFLGLFQASSSYYRFAAADTASPAFRPKAISWVMTGGVVAALFGTFLSMATVDLLAPLTFAGTFAAMAVLALACVGVLMLFQPPPTVLTPSSDLPTRPLLEIAWQPRYIVATGLSMMSFGIMVLVMTATPVAMFGCGFHPNDAFWVIQWHVLAMFVPSFFTGSLITRFGAERISAIGMLLLIAAAVSGLLGIRFENFAVGLILLGLGWNFGFIGGTTLLTSTYEPAERNKAQGLNDFLVFGASAITSLSAGKLLASFGWNSVNYAVFPMTALALGLILWLVRHRSLQAA